MNLQSKYLKAILRAYSSDKRNDLLLNAYERFSGKSIEDVEKEKLFTVKEIKEIDSVYKDRLENQIEEIMEDN